MPAPTLAEVLKQSGWSQEKIDALDAEALKGLNSYMSNVYQTAEQKEKAASDLAVKAEADRKTQEVATEAARVAQAAAELNERSVDDFWKNVHNPAIAAWEVEKNKLAKVATDAAAETAWYKAQHASLKDLGFVPADAPVFIPTVIAPPAMDSNKTPGTPTYTINDVRDQLGTSLGTVANIQWEYQTLYGKPMPISPTELLRQSDANKFKDPATYASQIFKFGEKREEMRQAAVKAHDDEIAAAERVKTEAEWKPKMEAQASEFAAKERKLNEQMSQHPDMTLPVGSAKFTEVRRAQQAGERPDPTKMTPEARIKLTQENLHKRFEERQQQVA